MCCGLSACRCDDIHLIAFINTLQDPAYPVYVDSSVIMGMTGDYNAGSTGFDGIQYMPCSPDNDFFPDLSKVGKPAALTSHQPRTHHADADDAMWCHSVSVQITSVRKHVATRETGTAFCTHPHNQSLGVLAEPLCTPINHFSSIGWSSQSVVLCRLSGRT